jgi:hypothetical protein
MATTETAPRAADSEGDALAWYTLSVTPPPKSVSGTGRARPEPPEEAHSPTPSVATTPSSA